MREADEVRPVEREFNEGLQAGVREMGSGMRAALERVTGGSVAGGVLRPGEGAAEAPREPVKFSTEAEALRFMADQLGIAEVEFSAGKKWKTWGKKFAKGEDRIRQMETVADEFDRMIRERPSLKGRLRKLYVTDAHRGRATLDGPAPEMAVNGSEWTKGQWKGAELEEAATGRRFSTFRRGRVMRDCFRHELGHTLSTPDAMRRFEDLWAAEGLDLAWFGTNVSNYAAGNKMEAIAESFSVYTREDYVKGTLPAALEDYLESITK